MFNNNISNMFTGDELTAYLQRKAVEYDRIAYVGDGTNDFCPVLRLRRYFPVLVAFYKLLCNHSQDMVLCRTGRGLQERINKKELGLKCSVHYWGGAWEVEELFNRLL